MATRTRHPVPTGSTPEETDVMVAAATAAFGDDVLTGVYDKMAHIMGQIGFMEKQGENKFHHYKYWSDDQISGYFRSWFAKLGIAFRISVESFDIREHETAKEGRSFLTTGIYRFTLTDVETGQTFSDTMLGQGDDPGDKGANKAVTGATKYWLLKTFLIGGEDAEEDERTDRRTEPSERRRRSSERDDERDERKVTITKSNIEGIQRGGRANKTTDAQLSQIRVLARELEWTPVGTARRVGEWLGDELELPAEAEEQGPALVRYLEGLSADDAGTIITKMVDLKDAPDEEDDNDDAEDERERLESAHLSDYP